LRAVRQGENIIGIAPLLIKNETASIIGSDNVCDYLDFIITPGREREFYGVLLDDLKHEGINHLDLGLLRPDSSVLTDLVPLVRERNYEINCREEGVSVEIDLPTTWEEYLAMLNKKQRHEIKRKVRRLWKVDNVEHRCLEVNPQQVKSLTDTFLKLFSLSQEEKANFMTTQMESFFRALTKTMAEIGLLRFGVIELDKPVAMTIGFDYNNTHYLYNSAYDTQYNSLSVGLLCKILCLKESIQRSKKKWDLLKGGESYKYHMGGKAIPLYSCGIIDK